MDHEIKTPDRNGLREFGLVTGGIVAGLFGLFFPWLLARPVPAWPWVIAGVLGGWGLVAPQSLGAVYRGWMKFGLLMSKVTTPVIMGIVFYLVITPIGLLRRLSGRDSLLRRFDTSASYRVPSAKPPVKNLERPF
jgi:hypothetical protein